MDGFLPCCPFDCQTSMDLDVQIDDFPQMESDFLDCKDEMNFPAEEITEKGQTISDYSFKDLSIDYSKSISEMIYDNCKTFTSEETLDKSVLNLSDSPSTSLGDANNETDVIINTTENLTKLSSVSKAFTIAILRSSSDEKSFQDLENIELFQDLNSLLKQGHHISEDMMKTQPSHDLTSDSTDHPSASTFEDLGSKRHSSESESVTSPRDPSESEEHYEPQNKVAKVAEDTDKNEKYYEMRRKNNISSRRSRLTKKQREIELEEREKHLIKENESLRKQEKELELLVQKVKDILFNSVKMKN